MTLAEIARYHRDRQLAALHAERTARAGYAWGCDDAAAYAADYARTAAEHGEMAAVLESHAQ